MNTQVQSVQPEQLQTLAVIVAGSTYNAAVAGKKCSSNYDLVEWSREKKVCLRRYQLPQKWKTATTLSAPETWIMWVWEFMPCTLMVVLFQQAQLLRTQTHKEQMLASKQTNKWNYSKLTARTSGLLSLVQRRKAKKQTGDGNNNNELGSGPSLHWG